jgi:hypothetical protein
MWAGCCNWFHGILVGLDEEVSLRVGVVCFLHTHAVCLEVRLLRAVRCDRYPVCLEYDTIFTQLARPHFFLSDRSDSHTHE